jgi:paraquat-inducible protein B
MATPTNHYKLGLFVLVAFGAAVVAGVLLGAASLRKDTVRYHTYFNESVQGLDLGSPVKFRGVTIGSVSGIDIAPDHRTVDVVSELDTKEVKRMGLSEAGEKHGSVRFAIPPDLRAQLGSQGITGVKFVAIDFFDVKSNPPPQLTFPVPLNHYIPAAPSMMKNLEDSITKAMDRLPEMVDAVVMIMGRVDRLLATLEKEDVSGKAAATLGHADAVMTTLQAAISRIDKQDLGGKAANTITELSVAVNKMNAVLDRLDGDKGLLASVQHASDSFGELGRAGRGTQHDLEATLRDVAEAAQAIHVLVDALERDPDMLLKGKTKPSRAAR